MIKTNERFSTNLADFAIKTNAKLTQNTGTKTKTRHIFIQTTV